MWAFYTPELYAEKSLELVRQAIKRVLQGNDYVIIDRCAGTGNLEQHLTDEELSHCILSTIEYREYKMLQKLYKKKVRYVVPTKETDGIGSKTDALSRAFIENPVICQYVAQPDCTIILFENPPYSEMTSIDHQKAKAKTTAGWKNSFVMQEMRKDSSIKGTVQNDLVNLFIWSAFKYYLREPSDSYIVYAPVKYWKAQHLISRKFLNGFAFNRRHFNTCTNACIMSVCSTRSVLISRRDLAGTL